MHATAVPFHDQQARIWSLTVRPEEYSAKQRNLRAFDGRIELCHAMMAFRKVVYYSAGKVKEFSAYFTQTSGRDAQSHRLAHDFNQHHYPALAVGHLVDAFDTSEWPIRQAHMLARLE